MGAETAAPISRGLVRRRAAAHGAGHDGPAAATPMAGNRARQALLGGVGPVMRSCGCGCGGSGSCDEPSVARQAAPGSASSGASSALGGVSSVIGRPGRSLDGGTRRRMESSFGRDFGGVRVHTDAAAASSARGLGAHAYTVGDHIVFGSGAYAPHAREGQRLIAHELTHTVQQRDGRHLQRSGTVSRPGDPHEREAVAVSNAVMAGRTVAPALAAPPGAVHRFGFGDVVDVVDSGLGAAGRAFDAGVELAGGALDAGVGMAGDIVTAGGEIVGDIVAGVGAAWDLAHDIARAVGGMVSVSGCGIVVTLPSIPVDYALTLDIPLPDVSLTVPIAAGVLPLSPEINPYGMLYFNLTAAPSLAVQLGPAALNGGSIVIDWCAPTYSGAVDFTYTLAAQLGGELRGGLGGEVGLEVNVPLPIPIPIANIDVGLVGALLGTAAQTVRQRLSLGYSGGALSYADHSHTDAGFKLSAGVGAFGSLTVLGFNLCTLYWPLWQKAWETTFSFDRALDLSIGSGGASARYSASLGTPGAFAFDDLPVALSTDVMTDDCPLIDVLCRVFYALGMMPSQGGGTWAGGHPPPLGGPLEVYPTDPGIPSKSLCRGACGPDCDTCTPIADLRGCVDDGGRHHWVVYSHAVDCPTHEACLDHDAAYDWCSAGMSGLADFVCHRLADLECACNNRASDCIGWIFGIGGSGRMLFAEKREDKPGCEGPCPQAATDPSGATVQRTCLPSVVLTDPLTLEKTFQDATRDIPIFSKIIPLPIVGGILLNVFANGSMTATGTATIDAIRLDNLCLDVDPLGPTYRGTAELHIPALLEGSIALTGAVTGTLGWPCVMQILRAVGGLTGTGTASSQLEFVNTVDIICDGGQLDLVNQASLTNALELGFDLEAFLRLIVLGFELFSDTWHLAGARFARSWEWQIGVLNRRGAGAGLILPALTVGSVSIVELLRVLLVDQPDAPPPASAPTPALSASATNAPAAPATSGLGGLLGRLLLLCGLPSDQPPAPGTARPSCGSPELPFTIKSFSGSDRGEGAIAQPLTRCSTTKGEKPRDNVFLDVRTQCLRPAKQENLWDRVHLLHGETKRSGPRNLHGPGTKENLILTDRSINQQMASRVESPALDAAYDLDKVLWWDVTVAEFFSGPSGHERFFGKQIDMQWGLFNHVDNTRGPAVVSESITSRSGHVPPPCPNFKPTP